MNIDNVYTLSKFLYVFVGTDECLCLRTRTTPTPCTQKISGNFSYVEDRNFMPIKLEIIRVSFYFVCTYSLQSEKTI
jgi:hypothetical protein